MDDILQQCSQIVDHTVFVSEWMSNYHQNIAWHCDSTSVIRNGVDLEIFKPREKINNGKINIVTHHWSNNAMKGFDIYNKLDKLVEDSDKFTFTYIGREMGSFKNTNVVAPLFGEDLGKELGRYDVYVSASRFDPGPNHILESLACKIPTYVFFYGGGCVEFAGNNMTYNSFDQLKEILELGNFTENDTYPYDWNYCLEQFYNLFEEII